MIAYEAISLIYSEEKKTKTGNHDKFVRYAMRHMDKVFEEDDRIWVYMLNFIAENKVDVELGTYRIPGILKRKMLKINWLDKIAHAEDEEGKEIILKWFAVADTLLSDYTCEYIIELEEIEDGHMKEFKLILETNTDLYIHLLNDKNNQKNLKTVLEALNEIKNKPSEFNIKYSKDFVRYIDPSKLATETGKLMYEFHSEQAKKYSTETVNE